VIPLDYITEWRRQVPWALDRQVEQDLILSRVIVEVFSVPRLAEKISFRGGTALYKLFLQPPARYSEDIDLVQISPEPIGLLLDDIRGQLDSWLGKPKRIAREGRVLLIYRAFSEEQPLLPLRVKIEINTREHFFVFGMEKREFNVHSRWYSHGATVNTFRLEELLGTKLRALYQRKKGRDLFDLYLAGRSLKCNFNQVAECFQQYLEYADLKVSRAEFERNLRQKEMDQAFLSDTAVLIAPGVPWDFAEAFEFVRRELISLLPGKPAKLEEK